MASREESTSTLDAFRAALSGVALHHFGSAEIAALTRLSGGASQELWSFDVVVEGRAFPLVLRRNPAGTIKRDDAAGMEVEARVMQLAATTGTPVPAIRHVLQPTDGLGSGFIMDRIPGQTLARRILRDPDLAAARTKLAFQLGQAAARIHRIEPARACLANRRNIAERLNEAEALYRSHGSARPVMEWALRWLRQNQPPEPPTQTVVHGDLRNGNIVVDAEGLRAVLDWEGVRLSDPMEDLAWICVPSWRFGEIDKPAAGVGTRTELFAGYTSVTHQPVDADRVRYWEVFGTLRWGLSCGVLAAEFIAGDRSVEKGAIGRRASETEIDLLSILAPRGGRAHA